jgi:hypothetical protein
MGDYGFYVTLDKEEEEEEKEKEEEEKLLIDDEEIIYNRNKQKIEIVEEWSFIDTIRCIWYIIQLLMKRHYDK